MNSEKIKNFFKSLLRNVVLSLALLLILEIICRIGTFAYYAPYGTSFDNQVMGMWRSDSSLIWDFQPYYCFHDKSGSVNEIGCREALGEVDMPAKEKGETWVLLSGGSAMLGTGARKDADYYAITQIDDHPKATAIDGYLEEYLNKKGKGKYRVFNCAVSGYTSWQAFQKVQNILAKYPMDWVISMDGQNDPGYISEGKTARNIMEEYWNDFLKSKHPFTRQFAWMQRSALIYCTLKAKYNFSESMKEEPNRQEIIAKWNNNPKERTYLSNEQIIEKGLLAFRESIINESAWLDKKGIHHLHFIQPHLSLRDKNKMAPVEKTIYNYYGSLQKDTLSSFMRSIHEMSWPNDKINTLREVHHLPFWVFTDYCHLTKEANKYIAERIGAMILKE